MERRFFIAWVPEPDERLLRAIARATGVAEARLLPTWWGCDKKTYDMPDSGPEEGALFVEFETCGARTMQLQIFGPAVSMGTAALGRAIALADRRPLLFSDCHLYPFTYMMAREDGAILHVLVRSDDAVADDFELLPDNPADPDYWRRDILFRARRSFAAAAGRAGGPAGALRHLWRPLPKAAGALRIGATRLTTQGAPEP